MSLADPRRILVVDSNEDTSFILTTLLSQSGYKAVAANNSQQALELVGANRFDAFVVGANLPDASGFEVCRRLVEIYPLSPVLIHAGDSSDARDEQEARSSGASGYIPGPLGMFQIVPKLKRLFRSVADEQLSIKSVSPEADGRR